ARLASGRFGFSDKKRSLRPPSNHFSSLRYTNAVTRYKSPFEKMVAQPDGSFKLVRNPKRMVIAYGFGGNAALEERGYGKRDHEAVRSRVGDPESLSNPARRGSAGDWDADG